MLLQYQIAIQYPYRKILPARSRIGFAHLCFINHPASLNLGFKSCSQNDHKTITSGVSTFAGRWIKHLLGICSFDKSDFYKIISIYQSSVIFDLLARDLKSIISEPPRVWRRLQSLRGCLQFFFFIQNLQVNKPRNLSPFQFVFHSATPLVPIFSF